MKRSTFLIVDREGQLATLPIKKEDGTVVLPAKLWMQAIAFTVTFDLVHQTCRHYWRCATPPKGSSDRRL